MTSDQVKTAMLLGVSAVAIYFGVKIYDKVKKTGGTVYDAAMAAAHEADIALGNIADSFRGFGIALSNQRLYRGEQGNGPYQLTPEEFDASTKAFIRDWSQKSGIPVDYAKWQVFSDGTIINPYGNYLQMDYASPAMDTADGYAVKEIWSNPRYSAGIITPYRAGNAQQTAMTPKQMMTAESIPLPSYPITWNGEALPDWQGPTA